MVHKRLEGKEEGDKRRNIRKMGDTNYEEVEEFYENDSEFIQERNEASRATKLLVDDDRIEITSTTQMEVNLSCARKTTPKRR